LHWKAASTYWALADDVYMTFSFDVPTQPAKVDPGRTAADSPQGDGSASGPSGSATVSDGGRTPLELLRAFQVDYHRLETIGPPVPLRLARKAERWIAKNEEWFPPQYRKFTTWRERKESPP
jgi:hypothetical protein